MTRRAVGLAFLALACGEPATWPAPVIGVPEFDVTEVRMPRGDSTRVAVTLIGVTGHAIATEPVFASRDTTVAVVDALGTVRARAVGGTWVIASVAGFMDSIPVTVGVRFVSVNVAWGHACAITDETEAYCWGASDFGKLMNGGVPARSVPTLVAGDHAIRAIAGGNNHTCLIDTAGAPWCQGGGSMAPPVALDTTSDGVSPARIATSTRFVDIRSGAGSSCGLTAESKLWCWGANTYGEAGTGASGPAIAVPVPAHPDRTFVQFDLGEHNGTCGLQADGVAFCWGHNDLYQLGREPLTHSLPAAEPLSGGYQWRSIELGPFNGCGVTTDSLGFCWGQTWILGSDRDTSAFRVSIPLPVAGNHRWRMIAVGHYHTCGLDGDGRAWCWGRNYGLTDRDHLRPVLISTTLRFTSVSSGSGSACGLATEGRVWCWGYGANLLAQPDGRTVSAEPVLIPNQLGPLTP